MKSEQLEHIVADRWG